MADVRGKRMSKTAAVKKEEVKDVGFTELELKIAKPSLGNDKRLVISGNFTELGSNIKKVVARYKDTVLTEDNVSYVKTLKSQFVSLRTGIERERKEYKKAYLDPAEKLLKSACDELLKIVDEGESALGKQLDEYDQRRKDELTVILTDYVDEYASKFNLREEYKAQIKLIDKYYNLTQKEEDSIDDIKRQAEELCKKQKDYDSGVALIEAECKEAGFMSDAYIREMEYKSATEILLEIKADKLKRDSIVEKAAEENAPVTVGKEIDEELKQAMEYSVPDKKEEERTRVLRVTYKASQAKLMAKFFTENHIAFEFIKTDF